MIRKVIKAINLNSNRIGYGPEPDYNDVVEERISIRDNGDANLSYYCYGNGHPYELCSTKTVSLHKDIVMEILRAVEICFTEKYKYHFVYDIGVWSLTLEYDDKKELRFSGSLIRDSIIESMSISQLIRKAFNDSSIWAFDGYEKSIMEGDLWSDFNIVYSDDLKEREEVNLKNNTEQQNIIQKNSKRRKLLMKMIPNIIVQEYGIIDVTNYKFDPTSKSPKLGYMCDGIVSACSDGRIFIHDINEDSELLEDFQVCDLKRMTSKINIFDPDHTTEIELLMEDKSIWITFEKIEEKQRFVETLEKLSERKLINEDVV